MKRFTSDWWDNTKTILNPNLPNFILIFKTYLKKVAKQSKSLFLKKKSCCFLPWSCGGCDAVGQSEEIIVDPVSRMPPPHHEPIEKAVAANPAPFDLSSNGPASEARTKVQSQEQPIISTTTLWKTNCSDTFVQGGKWAMKEKEMRTI